MKSKKVKWTKEELAKLKTLYENNLPVKFVSKLLGRSIKSIWVGARRYKFAKYRGRSIQGDSLNIKKFNKSFISNLKKNSDDFGVYTRRLSYMSEQFASIKLMELGYDVYKPILDSSNVDLLATKNGKLLKFQIKTAGYSDRFDYYETKLAKRKHTDKKSLTLKYDPSSIDYFIIKLPALYKFYIIPIKDTLKQKSANYRFFPNRTKIKTNYQNTDRYFEAFNALKLESKK